jgi:chromosome partitioning protein
MAKVFAIANQKGGVGKTTSAVTLAHGAALKGIPTCLIDLDPQGNVADSLGMAEGNELISWLEGRPVICQAREQLGCIRSDKSTAAIKATLAGRDYREYVISEALEHPAFQKFELIILDCAPSIDILHVAALTAADYLVIPSRLDQLAVKGILEILRTMASVNKRGAHLKLGGIIPTFFDRSTKESQYQLENLAVHFKHQLWPVVPVDTKIRSANRAGQTLWEFAPACRALRGLGPIGGGYVSVLDRLLTLLK